MSIGIRCQACAREYHVNPALAGKRVKCKACGAAIRVPVVAIDPHAASISAAPAFGDTPQPSATETTPPTAKPARVPKTKPPQAKAISPERSSSISAAILAESEARAEVADRQLAIKPPPKPAPPGGPMRRVYQAIAAIVILGFFGLVYLLGREAGIWGSPEVRRSQVARVLTPAEQLARDRYISKSNLIRLGLSLDLWAKSHRGMYPTKLNDVNEVAELTPDVFQSPFANDQTSEPPRDSSYRYLYVRSMGVAIHNATVLAYDAAELAAGQGANVLYGSGEVKWIPAAELAGEIAQSESLRLGIAASSTSDREGDKLASRPADHIKQSKRRRD